MKILLFTDNLGAGGAQRQLVGLADLLHSYGYTVKVCYYQSSLFFSEYLKNRNIPYELISGAENKTLRIFKVCKYFAKENPDWVIAYQEMPSTISCIAKLFYRRFKLLTSERTTTQILTWKDRLRFGLYRFADWIVPNSYSQASFIISRYSSLKAKVKPIINFVDLDKFQPTDNHVVDNYQKHLILVVASLYKTKNAINFIKAVKILRNRGLSFSVQWYGKISDSHTQYCEECENLISLLNLGDTLTLKDKEVNILPKYHEATIFCLPSLFEGTPNVICEAMACGLPIVCSHVSDNGVYVKDGYNGFLFNPLDPEDIANGIEKALSLSGKQYREFRINSRSCAEELFSKKLFLNSYLKILTQ